MSRTLPLDTSASSTNGTWSPTFGFATPGDSAFTGVSGTSTYAKLGSLVILRATLIFTPTFTTASGDFQITNLPFTVVNAYSGPVYSNTAGLSWGAGRTQLGSVVSGSTVTVRAYGSGVAFSVIGASSMTSGVQVGLVVNLSIYTTS